MGNTPTSKTRFSARHPLLFGMTLIIVAVVLFMGTMAFFRSLGEGGSFSDAKIGLCHLEGPITDASDVLKFLARLRDDDGIKGVLLRIDSPGGAVAPSQELYESVKRLAAVKPVVVSMGTAAASGGYYAACPATLIVADPGTITGSIGVRADYLNVQGLLAKLGLKTDTLASGPMKTAGSPTSPLTPEQRAYLQAIVMDLRDQFVSDVASGRHLSKKYVSKLADGRAYTGRQALSLKLVDRLGGQDAAMDILCKLAKVSRNSTVLEGPEKKLPFVSRLFGSTLSGLGRSIGQGLGESLAAAPMRLGAAPDGLLLEYRR